MQILISISCILNKSLPPFSWRVTGRRSGLKGNFFSFRTAVTPHGKGLADQNRMSTRCSVLCLSERQKGQSALWLHWLRKGSQTHRKPGFTGSYAWMHFFFRLLSRTAMFSKENGIWKQASFLWRYGGGGAAGWFTAVVFSEHHSQIQPALQWAGETWGILGWNLLLNFSWSAPSRIMVGSWKDG